MLDNILISLIITMIIAFVVEATKVFQRVTIRKQVISIMTTLTVLYLQNKHRLGRSGEIKVQELKDNILSHLSEVNYHNLVTNLEIKLIKEKIMQFSFSINTRREVTHLMFSLGIKDIVDSFQTD